MPAMKTILKKVRRLVMFLVVLLGAAVVAFVVIGPDRLWRNFGPPDLGEVDFATLQRRDTPNDALACRAGVCAARFDIESPVFAIPAADLFARVSSVLAGEPRLQEAARDPAQGTLRLIQRSQWLGFPDTINVKVVALPEGGSTVLLYSRSQLGRADMGVNRARIARWVGLAEAAAGK